jgi:acetyltransferase-like isoleucine patch superfamily enzyme
MKTIIKKLISKLYYIGLAEARKDEEEKRRLFLSYAAIVGSNSQISSEAIIINLTSITGNISIGKDCVIRGELRVFNTGGKIQIGDYCYIGPASKLWSSKEINIGDRVLISHNVNIHDNNSHSLDDMERHQGFIFMISNNGLLQKQDFREKPIVIEDDVWIGFNATIAKGVRIGKGAIISANSVVIKDVEEYTVVAGNPAKAIKKLI